MLVVAKIGTSSVTAADGSVDTAAVGKLCGEVANLRRDGHTVVVVTSGAVTAGVAAMSSHGEHRRDPMTLQALSAIGQPRLMRVYEDAFAEEGLLAGQVLVAPLDFTHRQRYLHARDTFSRLLELGVVPIVNENDAIADDEIRFGDNDRLAALVAHLLRAEVLVLLTDTVGLLTADPRHDAAATLIEEVAEIDHELEKLAGGAGSEASRGGMASKLAAAKMAVWSGSRVVIASARRPAVLADAVAGSQGVGTTFLPHPRTLGARKLWIAFALRPAGKIIVDDGARRALIDRRTSLLPAGVVAVEGGFEADDAVEIVGEDRVLFAKGIARLGTTRASEWVGRQTADLPDDLPRWVVHGDDIAVF
ncbi:MAG: glutamate 5-kinase [Acidimicrobiales bacterium]|jgi:glutamate 5-kinase